MTHYPYEIKKKNNKDLSLFENHQCVTIRQYGRSTQRKPYYHLPVHFKQDNK